MQEWAVTEGTVLWEPTPEAIERSNLTRYVTWLEETHGRRFDGYADLWEWSVTDLEGFWGSLWEYFEIPGDFDRVLEDPSMPGAGWFPGTTLNYAERALARRDDHIALIAVNEAGGHEELTYAALADRVAAVAAGLRKLGVERGDRVAALMPNIPETLVAFLATASIGAVWSSCSPEFGTGSIIHRFGQIEPTVLLAVDGYRYGGTFHDRLETVFSVRSQLPGLGSTVILPESGRSRAELETRGLILWEDLEAESGPRHFERVPFDHPLWVVYSSGTTGLPKPIVHSQGGILLEHLKEATFHIDLRSDDRFFWYTSTGWMMWNLLVAGLLVGTTVVLYDGSPNHPDLNALWAMAEGLELTYFGTSAPFIQACMKAGLRPGSSFDLHRLHSVGSTGAPLPPEGFAWVYEQVGRDLLLGSISGGTDLCTGFVGACALLPVRAGEIQCRQLGAKVEAFDVNGRPVLDEVGELVISAPMPSMPIYFWNDPDGKRYRSSYFEMYPGVWRHGDWIKVLPDGACVIYGRSDSTLNRGAIRMGTSEFYRVVDEFAEIADSLVIDTGQFGQEGRLLLFVVMAPGIDLDETLRQRLRVALRTDLSPRHVPDEILEIPEVPRTLNGKKLEVPVKRILAGVPVEQAARRDAMANPESIDVFVGLIA
jgi:acetoacetyl-CoA synthetase